MTEFLLPLNDDCALEVGDWLSAFSYDTTDCARKRLKHFWAPVRTPEFMQLAGHLLESEKFGIDDRNFGFLFGESKDVTGTRIGDRWYLPSRDPLIDFSQCLTESGHGSNSELLEFLTYFGGIGDDPEYYGQFMFRPPWKSFSNEVHSWFNYRIDGYSKWEDALMLYESLDGSVALIRKDGSIGWWMTAELRVRHFAANLAEFVSYYTKSRKSKEPFCCYSFE